MERLSLIYLGSLFQRRLPRIRVNVFHGEWSVPEEGPMYFPSLNDMGKNSSENNAS